MKTVRIQSSDRMSNRQYHGAGKPNWWARVGKGDSAKFLKIGSVRGDDRLDVTIEVNDDITEIAIGAGPNNRYGVRETVNC